MPDIASLFATPLYRAELGRGHARLHRDVRAECQAIAADDRAGQAWSRAHGYQGYTSYASLNDLTWRSPVLAELEAVLGRHVATFARTLEMDTGRRAWAADSLWINCLAPGGHHAAHIHPHSVISGTYYVEVPKGASAIRFEDPRLGLMMAAPPRKATARIANRTFVDIKPKPGTVLLWESWLRHEVPVNKARTKRVSLSFNYRLQ